MHQFRLLFFKELTNVKQTLVINGFWDSVMENQIRLFLSEVISSKIEDTEKKNTDINIFNKKSNARYL